MAIDSLRLVRRIVHETRAMRPYACVEHSPGAAAESDEELLAAAGNIGTTIFHPVGLQFYFSAPCLSAQWFDNQFIRLVSRPRSIAHAGTAKMGQRSDPLAVVSPLLLVHGVSGLRAADASVMPSITSGNTAAPTMAIAERAAQEALRAHADGRRAREL